MMQQNKAQNQNMLLLKTQGQASQQPDQMTQQGQILQTDGIQVQQQIVQAPITEPPQYIGSTIIRPQGAAVPQTHVQIQGARPSFQQQHPQQQFMSQMQQTVHQRAPVPAPTSGPSQVTQAQKQQILVNQPFNIQQTRIITSIPAGGQQIITSQPINPSQGGQLQQQPIGQHSGMIQAAQQVCVQLSYR